MEKRLTVDLPEERYNELLRIQLDKSLAEKKKVSLAELIKTAVIEWLDKEKAAQ